MNKTFPAVSDETLRKKLAAAIFDPGATEGYKGDRTLTEWQTDAVMRALAAQGQEPGYVIPLVWKEAARWTGYGLIFATAQTRFGYYGILKGSQGKFEVYFGDAPWSGAMETEEEAKAWAQSDFETRIRSALTAPAQPAGVPDGWRLVPLKLTPEMDQAGSLYMGKFEYAYHAALMAAPQPPAEGGWMPIESAPKDGTHILAYGEEPCRGGGSHVRETFWALYGKGSIAKQRFDRGEGPSGAWNWVEPIHNWGSSWTPSHWMPLPPAPANGGDTHG